MQFALLYLYVLVPLSIIKRTAIAAGAVHFSDVDPKFQQRAGGVVIGITRTLHGLEGIAQKFRAAGKVVVVEVYPRGLVQVGERGGHRPDQLVALQAQPSGQLHQIPQLRGDGPRQIVPVHHEVGDLVQVARSVFVEDANFKIVLLYK